MLLRAPRRPLAPKGAMKRTLLFAALAVACASPHDEPKTKTTTAPVRTQKPRVTPETVLLRPRTQAELPTTDAKIFLGNLDARVSAGSKVWKKNPGSSAAALLYAGPRVARGKLHGDLGEISAGLDDIEAALAKSPRDPSLLALASSTLSTMHRFDEALTLAEKAHELRPDSASRATLADLRYNLGQYDESIPEIRALAERHPTFGSLVKLAHLEQDLGNVTEAEQAFACAETLFRDVSPLPIAWLNVQRGLFYLHTGRFDRAEAFYRAAVERLPSYPMALEHLAELEGVVGKTAAAEKHYRKVIALTNDPEFLGALSRILEKKGQHAEADELLAQAKKRYAKLIRKYPEAMAWHAAELFLSAGDAKRAVELLTDNAKLRPNAVSYAALAKAELEAGNLEAAATNVDRALATPLRRADILWTAARVRKAQGKSAEAERLAHDARAQNPKIEVLEGSL